MNRLLALLIVATIAGGTAFGQSQGARRAGSAPVRMGQNSSSSRMSSVPRPAPSSRRIPATLIADQSILDSVPGEEVVYDDEPEMVLGESYSAEEAISGIDGGCASCGDVGCESCGESCGVSCGLGFDICNPGGFDGRQVCICLPSHGWASVEYLMFYQKGMVTPSLVTDGTNVLYGGNNDILTNRLNGLRVKFGWWFVNRPNLGIEGEYVGTGEATEAFDRTSTGGVGQVLIRPYFDSVGGVNAGSIVAQAGIASPGRVRVESKSELVGAGVRFKRLLYCSSQSGCAPLLCEEVPMQSRYEATLGWRYFQLDESLNIQENKTVVGPGTQLLINDRFRTFNQFNGVELGVNWQGRRGYWTLDTLMRVGIGNTRQKVFISGDTTFNGNVTAAGGVLALPTNIQATPYVRDELGVVPELGATLGYQVTQRLKLTAGYSFIYWSNVVRPGEQIDFNIDPNWMPSLPAGPGGTRQDPRFAFTETGYFIQGLTLGGEYRW